MEVTTIATWRCKCELLWYNCGLHKHEASWKIDKGKGKDVGREKLLNLEKGVDKPMLVSRKGVSFHEVACTGMQPLVNNRFRLDPSSVLAARFP